MPLSREETRRLEIVLRAYLDDVATVRITEEAAYGSGTGATPTSHIHARNRVQDPTARTAADWLMNAAYQAARWRVTWIQHAYGTLSPWMRNVVALTYWQPAGQPAAERVADILHISRPHYYRLKQRCLTALGMLLPAEWRDPLQWGDVDPDHALADGAAPSGLGESRDADHIQNGYDRTIVD
jgi:hypothetical protein